MRVLALFALLVLSPLNLLWSCSCIGAGPPSHAAGQSAAVFTGTVLGIENPVFPPAPVPAPGVHAGDYRARGLQTRPSFPVRTVRLQIRDVLAGVPVEQAEIEILTGTGGGDCGYPFQPNEVYVVYADKRPDGKLRTSICSRTRPLHQAAEDLAYFRSVAHGPATGTLRVHTRYPSFSTKKELKLIAEFGASRYWAITNAAGIATFSDLQPGKYTIHSEEDGDLPDDPAIEVNAKGIREITLFRFLTISGRLTKRDGQPAEGVGIELRSVDGKADESSATGKDGNYRLRTPRAGSYYFGVNLNHTATPYSPYPRWFYPGTEDQASAAVIEFNDKPETRTYHFTLPERLPERTIEGTVLDSNGHPLPVVRLGIFDSSDMNIASASADPDGRFKLSVFAGVAYRLHAVSPGSDAMSAVPVDIPPGTAPLRLQVMLTQTGNTFFEKGPKGPAQLP